MKHFIRYNKKYVHNMIVRLETVHVDIKRNLKVDSKHDL